jgi:hypothetical protein
MRRASCLSALVAGGVGFVLASCSQLGAPFGVDAALRGWPDFPPAGMLPPETQRITAAAVARPMPSLDWQVSSKNCSDAISKDDQGISTADPTYQVKRNNCINEFIGAINYQYNIYKEQVFKLANGLNASSDTLGTILSAGAAAAGGSAGQILSGIAASIGTLKGNLNQDILYNQTIPTIIAKMDADRADKLTVILQQMKPSDDKQMKPPYTMYAASLDLLDYFEAGTVHHAIVDLQNTTGAKTVACKTAVNNLKTTGTKSGGAPALQAPAC